MKKNLLIFLAAIIAISAAAIGFTRADDACCSPKTGSCASPGDTGAQSFYEPAKMDFLYSIEPRFMHTVTKETVDEANSIFDIVSSRELEGCMSYHNIRVSSFFEEREKEESARSESEVFTDAQKQILRSLEYGASFSITGNVNRANGSKENRSRDTLIFYMTVVPEQPAVYNDGNDVLLQYLEDNSQEVVALVREGKISPGRISFVVTKDGAIDRVRLSSSCGYTPIDERMLQLIGSLPGKWDVGINAKGERVNQEMIFSFGQQGC